MAGQRGRESGCRLVPGKGERDGKVLWQPVAGGGDGEGTLEQGRAEGREQGQPRLSYAKGRSSGAVFSLSITHILHTSSCLWDAQPGRPGVSKRQRHRQEGSGGSCSRDKCCFAQHRLACTDPPSAPWRPTTYKACGKVLLAPESQSCGGREVEVQEVGSRGGEHPCSWELPGRQVGSSLCFSSSLDTGVGQPALQQTEMLEKSWVC